MSAKRRRRRYLSAMEERTFEARYRILDQILADLLRPYTHKRYERYVSRPKGAPERPLPRSTALDDALKAALFLADDYIAGAIDDDVVREVRKDIEAAAQRVKKEIASPVGKDHGLNNESLRTAYNIAKHLAASIGTFIDASSVPTQELIDKIHKKQIDLTEDTPALPSPPERPVLAVPRREQPPSRAEMA